ncbi:hypothetical protein JI666_20070, partial [Bacillus sp. NTK071]|nr:hypothetical protein [Bacillus sp. NTK071]
FQSGDISVSNYQVGTMSAIPAYKTVMSGVSSDSIGTNNLGKAVKNGKSVDSNYEMKFNWLAPFNSPGAISARIGDAYAGYISARDRWQGFKIQKVKKGSIYKYRVYESKHNKFTIPPKNGRKYKIYNSNYIKSQVKIGNAQKLRVSKFINVKSGTVSALKSKLGWIGIGIGTVDNIKKNVEDNESTSKIIGDAAVDVAIGAATLAVGGAAAAVAVGLGAPVLVGTAAAIIVSVGASLFLDGIKIEDKTIGNHLKSGIDSAAGWFKNTVFD